MTAIKPRTMVVPLFQGDDLARIEDLEGRALAARAVEGARRMNAGSDALDAAKAHDDFVTEATERAVQVTMQALPRKKWAALVAEHPAEKDNTEHLLHGFNVESMSDPLVLACVQSAVSPDPEFVPDWTTEAARQEFLDSLSDGDFSKLFSAAVVLNKATGSDPKADLSSRLTRTYVETSESQRISV